MSERLSLKINRENSELVDQLFSFLQENPSLLDQGFSSRTALINYFLHDYLSFLIDQWQSKPQTIYSDVKRQIVRHGKKKPAEKELLDLEHNMMDRLNMLMYLQMDTNRAIVRADNHSYLKLKSMFDPNTEENQMFAKVSDLVNEDNDKLFKKISSTRKEFAMKNISECKDEFYGTLNSLNDLDSSWWQHVGRESSPGVFIDDGSLEISGKLVAKERKKLTKLRELLGIEHRAYRTESQRDAIRLLVTYYRHFMLSNDQISVLLQLTPSTLRHDYPPFKENENLHPTVVLKLRDKYGQLIKN